MKYFTTLIYLLLSFVSNLNAQDLELELFASNLDRPVNIKHAGDDRLFVVEQQGFISIVNADGSVNPIPFLNIDSKVGPINNIGDERGLLGLAFHPNYSSNGYFYVNYFNNNSTTVISRFTRDATNPSIADPNSELILLSYAQPFNNHNGGDLAFGDDGYLYIASGDGGSGGDPQNNAQNTNSLLGKLLRIDVDNITPNQNYSIPADNPFVGDAESKGEIWAYGLRNPWKFSFDRLTGDIWIADVGQNAEEEINLSAGSASGLNYGWRCYEGSTPYNTNGCPEPSSLSFPVAEYNHFTDGQFKCSITGGYRYRGSAFPGFNGWYFFADYCSEEIGYLIYDDLNAEWNMTFDQFSGNWTAFGEDSNGEIYVSDIQTGNIYKLVDASLSINDENITRVSIFPNPVDDELNIKFSSVSAALSASTIIYNSQGKAIETIETHFETIKKIDTSNLNSGFYILQIRLENGEQYTHKIVVNK